MLWGPKAKFRYLLLASFLIIFTCLGSREIWTQEHRWADIVSAMFLRNDFLHPYLGEHRYYDKPLLSYWLIVLLVKITGYFNTWALRLPSACAALITLWSTYQIGKTLSNKPLGLLAGWLLLTTFYFVFWARVSSADMLNLAGSTLAVAWYFIKREQAGFLDYTIFFIIIGLTCLCKGLIGAVVPLFAVLIDMMVNNTYKQHIKPILFLSLIPALLIYLAPFAASAYFDNDVYNQNGLYLVYRENILRFFKPFDHQGPIYTYFVYLPVYLLPWAFFFIPAVASFIVKSKTLNKNARWMGYMVFALFLFFTLSGSRRSYYVLPIVPFALLFTADWILSEPISQVIRKKWTLYTLTASFILLFLAVDLLPAWYYSQFGVHRFSAALKHNAAQIKSWESWNVVMLDAESKLNFYLDLAPTVRNYGVRPTQRQLQTSETLMLAWPILKEKPSNTIFITRKIYASALQKHLPDYTLFEITYPHYAFLSLSESNTPVAFIPKNE